MKIKVLIMVLTILLPFTAFAQYDEKTIGEHDMILVEGGTYTFGGLKSFDYAREIHEVSLSSFYISKYEITNEQFVKFLNIKGNQEEGGRTWYHIKSRHARIEEVAGKFIVKEGFERHPVYLITWFAANAYARYYGFRLPTESEWEYAAKGGNKSKGFRFAGSNEVSEVSWHQSNSGRKTHEVGTLAENELGIYDMSGNVSEWCADWYDKTYYTGELVKNPRGPESGERKLVRGGTWYHNAEDAQIEGFWNILPEDNILEFTGFRVVRDK